LHKQQTLTTTMAATAISPRMTIAGKKTRKVDVVNADGHADEVHAHAEHVPDDGPDEVPL
jgi:hypothetical protein